MPAGDGIVFKYDTYEFDPRPLFTVNKEIIKTPSNTGLATKYSLTLAGTILPTGIDPIDNNKGGLTEVFSGVNALRDAFGRDFKLLMLQCDTDTALISGYPKVLSVDISNASDNYIRRADYTIQLELASLTGRVSEPVGVDCQGIHGDLSASGLISITDDVTVEFMDERIGGDISITEFGSIPSVFSIQRSLSAQGDPLACTASWGMDSFGVYTEPWERARAYVAANLGLTSTMTGLVDLMCVSGMSIANNFRSISVNRGDGTVSATETWVAFTGAYPATEEFEVSIDRSMDSPLTSINVNGTIQGLSTVAYEGCTTVGGPTGAPKFNNALSMWSGVAGISGSLVSRASAVYNSFNRHKGNPTGILNTEPLTESLGYNIVGGVVTYNYTYDDRPVNCYTGALLESIAFTFTQPNDVFASLVILGKSQGPLFQDINTSGVTTRDLSIDAIIPIEGRCGHDNFWSPPAVYDTFVSDYESELSTEFDQVFVNSHSQSWEPKVGHFTLSKSWTVGYCK